jgi:hypothetical protein
MVKQLIQPLGHPASVCLSAEGKFQNLFSDLFLEIGRLPFPVFQQRVGVV